MLTAASPAFLWEMARAPMRFREVLAVMARLLPCRFVDLSPGATLGTFVKHHFSPEQRPESLAIVTRFGTDMQSFTHVVARNRVRTAHG